MVADDPGDGVPAATGAYPTIRPLSGDEARPGEEGALARLEAAAARADDYPEERDLPAIVGTTELSIDLRFGTLSPRTVATVVGDATPGRAAVVRQLAWRDWYAHLLFERPGSCTSVPHSVDHSIPAFDNAVATAASRIAA